MKAEPRRLPGFLDCGGGLIGRMQIEASEKRRGYKKKVGFCCGRNPRPRHSGRLERGVFLEACDDANGEPSAISPTPLDSTFSRLNLPLLFTLTILQLHLR